MTADLEKLAGEIEEHHAGRDTCNPYDRAHHEATLQHLMLNNAPAIAAALREVSALREALEGLRELSERATPGPWQSHKEAFDDDDWERQFVFHAPDEHTEYPCAFPLGGTKEDDNAALIVAAVNYVRARLAAQAGEG